mgnify:CR=1 FL=1
MGDRGGLSKESGPYSCKKRAPLPGGALGLVYSSML